jgi:hypothetical protein
MFAAVFAGQCLPMEANEVRECQVPEHKTRGLHGPPRLFSPLLYQLSYLARETEQDNRR